MYNSQFKLINKFIFKSNFFAVVLTISGYQGKTEHFSAPWS